MNTKLDHIYISCFNGTWTARIENTDTVIARGSSEMEVHDACVKLGYRIFTVNTAGDMDFVKSMKSTNMHD